MADISGPVVVGYDGSPASECAVDWAAVESVQRQRDLVVLFAADQSGLYGPRITPGHHGDLPRKMAYVIAEAGVTRARAAAPEASIHSKATGLGAAVALTQESVRACLLVVGGRGRSRLSEALLGTVQFAVTAHADCTVVVVPPGSHGVPDAEHPVVVGVDGSEGSSRAVCAAAAVARDRGAELRVVGAWQAPQVEHWTRFDVVDEEWRQEVSTAVRVAAAHNVTTAIQAIKTDHPDLDVRELVCEGRPSLVLANESDNAGLVVVGARGRGDLASLLLGSVGRSLIHTSGCPVAVIR